MNIKIDFRRYFNPLKEQYASLIYNINTVTPETEVIVMIILSSKYGKILSKYFRIFLNLPFFLIFIPPALT